MFDGRVVCPDQMTHPSVLNPHCPRRSTDDTRGAMQCTAQTAKRRDAQQAEDDQLPDEEPLGQRVGKGPQPTKPGPQRRAAHTHRTVRLPNATPQRRSTKHHRSQQGEDGSLQRTRRSPTPRPARPAGPPSTCWATGSRAPVPTSPLPRHLLRALCARCRRETRSLNAAGLGPG